MNIIVCIKLVPSVMEVAMDQQYTIKRDSVVQTVNPADEAALEAALRIRGNGSVTVVTMGKQSAEEPLRSMLSRGADRAVLVTDQAFAGADTYATAKTLSAAIRFLGNFDLILCGRRAIDGETGQVPPELAVMLGLVFVTNCTSVSCSDGVIECLRLLEDGTEELKTDAPAVLSLCEYSYPLRPSSIQGLRRAKEQQVMTLTHEQLGLEYEDCGLAGSPTRVRAVTRQVSGVRNAKIANDINEGITVMKELIREVVK